jgi:hypothetical protein
VAVLLTGRSLYGQLRTVKVASGNDCSSATPASQRFADLKILIARLNVCFSKTPTGAVDPEETLAASLANDGFAAFAVVGPPPMYFSTRPEDPPLGISLHCGHWLRVLLRSGH